MNGTCQLSPCHSFHHGCPRTFQPEPHSSVMAVASFTTTGVPHDWASRTGIPKPSPYDAEDRTSIAEYHSARSAAVTEPMAILYWSLNETAPATPFLCAILTRFSPVGTPPLTECTDRIASGCRA